MTWNGEPMERRLRPHGEAVGWTMVARIGLAILVR